MQLRAGACSRLAPRMVWGDRDAAGGLAAAQGESLDGHDIDLLRVGTDDEGKRRIWIIGRQHPGESMAGALRRGKGGGGAHRAGVPCSAAVPAVHTRRATLACRPASFLCWQAPAEPRPMQRPLRLQNITRPLQPSTAEAGARQSPPPHTHTRAAEHFIEGLLRRLVDPHDATSRALLRQCVFYVVPCM